MKYVSKILLIIIAFALNMMPISSMATESQNLQPREIESCNPEETRIAKELLSECAKVAEKLKTEADEAQEIIQSQAELIRTKDEIIEEAEFQKTGWRDAAITLIIMLLIGI